MKVDLQEILEAPSADVETSLGIGGEEGAFPEVLASKLNGPGAGASGPADRKTSRQTTGAGAEEPADPGRDAEAAAESGAVSPGASANEPTRLRDESGGDSQRGADAASRSTADGEATEDAAADGLFASDEADDAQSDAARAALAQLEELGDAGSEEAAGLREGGARVASELVAAEAREGESAQEAGLGEDVDDGVGLEELAADSGLGDREGGREEAASRHDAAPRPELAPPPDAELARAQETEAGIRAPSVTPVDGSVAVASPVAGQVTETTVSGAPGSPQPAVASDAIAVQTEWLATRGGGTARLVLHPAELGEIAIRVTLRGGAVDVVMVAQEAVAQGVAEEQSERLAQAFANRDLRLESFEVRRGGAEDALADGGPGFGDADPRGEEQARGEGDRGGSAGGAASGGESTPLPRIANVAPETGVDLRV